MRRVLAKFPHQLSCVNIPLFASGGKFRAGFSPSSKADQSQCRGGSPSPSHCPGWGQPPELDVAQVIEVVFSSFVCSQSKEAGSSWGQSKAAK